MVLYAPERSNSFIFQCKSVNCHTAADMGHMRYKRTRALGHSQWPNRSLHKSLVNFSILPKFADLPHPLIINFVTLYSEFLKFLFGLETYYK